MARIVCQVLHRPNRVTFIWSEGKSFFPPYHLRGAQVEAFRRLAGQARMQLAEAATRGPDGLAALSHVGTQMYHSIFPAEHATANEVRNWLAGLQQQGAIESLEIVSDAPGLAPWNVVSSESGSLWGMSCNLVAGRRVNAWRQVGLLEEPRVLVAVDPLLRDMLPDDDKARFLDWAMARSLEVATSKRELEASIRSQVPDLLYLYCRVNGRDLQFGHETIAPAELHELLENEDADTVGTLIFVNACRTEAASPAEPILGMLRPLGDGLIASEQPAPPREANEFGISFLERFVWEGVPLVQALADARQRSGPVGLLYSAFCPGNLCVSGGEVAPQEPVMDAPEPLPLPNLPYRPLAPYDREEQALFTGREKDTSDLAELLDRPETRLAIVHGGSGVGKSSLLRAGVLPYLEDWSVGFRALRDRMAEESPAAEADCPVISIRASQDLAGQLAEALCAFCDRPLVITAPTGSTANIDLPGLLRECVTGNQALSEAIQSVPRESSVTSRPASTVPPPLPESQDKVTPVELWEAMQNDPGLLTRLLATLTERLPHELVILIEQGEELFTQVSKPAERRRRRLALEMLARFAQTAGQCKIILSMRTEFFGEFLEDFPVGDKVPTFLVEELADQEVISAIQLPTANESVAYSDQIPQHKYRFAFEEGVPYAILRDVRAAADRRGGLLPSIQAVCAQLFDLLRERSDRVIRNADWQSLLRQSKDQLGLADYVQGAVEQTFASTADRQVFKHVAGQLVHRDANGTICRHLVPANALSPSPEQQLPLLAALYWLGWIGGAILILLGWFQIVTPMVGWIGFGIAALASVGSYFWPARRTVSPDAGGMLHANDTAAISLRKLLHEAAAPKTGLLEVNDLLIGGKEGSHVTLSQDSLAQIVAGWVEDGKRQKAVRARTSDLLWIFVPLLFLAGAVILWFARQSGSGGEEAPVTSEKLQRQVKQFQAALEDIVYPMYVGRLNVANQAMQSGNALRARQALLGQQNKTRSFEWHYLWKRNQPELYNLPGHAGTIESVALAPGGRLAASASLDGTVKVWDVTNGQIQTTYTGHGGPVFAVAIASDDKTIASAGADNKVHVWEVGAAKDYAVRKKADKVLSGHQGPVLSLAFAPKDLVLASGSLDKTVILWDLAKDDKKVLKDHDSPVQVVTFSADRKTLASAGIDSLVLVWDVAAAKKKQSIKATARPIFALAFAPDGKTLAGGGVEARESVDVGVIRIWDPDTGKPTTGSDATVPRMLHSQGVFTLAYSPDGKTLASGGKDNHIRLWDPSSGEPKTAITGHLGWVRSLAFKGHTIVTGSYDQTVRVWDVRKLANPEILEGHKDWVCSVAFSEDDKLLASGSRDGTVKLWDPARGQVLETLELGAPVMSVAFSPGKGITRLAAGTWADNSKGEVRTWEVTQDKGKVKVKELHRLQGLKRGVACVAFSTDASALAAAGEERTIQIWDVVSGKAGATLKGHPGAIRCLAFAPENDVLASGGEDRAIVFWDWKAGRPVGDPITGAHNAAVTALAYFPAGTSLMVSAGNDQGIDLWKSDEHKHRGTFRGHSNGLLALATSPRGDLMASAGWDRTIKLWSPSRPGTEERFTLLGHQGPVRGLAFSSDARILASGSHDGTVCLWRAAAPVAQRHE